MQYQLLLAVGIGIAVLLFLVLFLRIPAFAALLLASLTTGLTAGMPPQKLIDAMQTGMGNTLGFVATVVGLGAFFGALLEHSGGAQSVAVRLIDLFGLRKAPLALAATGFIVAMPVFFDVAFIILMPVLYALQRRSGRSLLLFALPLLAGLAVGHAFVPPTPGPVAVAQILKADLGWTILAGIMIGLPTALLCGVFYGNFMADKMHVAAPVADITEPETENLPSAGFILVLILLPIALILMQTAVKSGLIPMPENSLSRQAADLFGSPLVALLAANAAAWIGLGLRRGYSSEALLDVTTRSLAPAGVIILVTGAGGVFKQVLVETGAGKMLADGLNGKGIPVYLLAFLAAALVRVLQGSATVAMITAAGIVAPIVAELAPTPFQSACLVMAIASGATTASHVNDSGFWMVKQYLNLSEKETFRTWTILTSLIALCGLAFTALFWHLGAG